MSTAPDAHGSMVHPSSKRVEFVDLLRGWAVIVMVETHIANATLTPEISASGFFQYVKFFNGLVAPSFLFASGLAYAITTRRKLHDYLSWGRPLFRQFGRLFFILALGYMLHVPKFSFEKVLNETTTQDWQVFFQVDILHCIAVSLLLVQVVLLVLKDERKLYLALAVLAIAIVFATPYVWGVDFWTIVPWPIAAYLNGLHFSLFPLFPWSAFLIAGAVTGYFYLQARDVTIAETGAANDRRYTKILFGIGSVLVLLSFAIEPLAAGLYRTYDYWMFSPSFVLLRLGLVLLLCAGMLHYEQRHGVPAKSIVTLVGRESLVVYVVHLLMIYGDFGKFNFVKEVDHTFGYGVAAIATAVLLITMYVLALIWSRIKRSSPRLKLVINLGTLVGALGMFFFGPGE